jgi:hypothetical protein
MPVTNGQVSHKSHSLDTTASSREFSNLNQSEQPVILDLGCLAVLWKRGDHFEECQRMVNIQVFTAVQHCEQRLYKFGNGTKSEVVGVICSKALHHADDPKTKGTIAALQQSTQRGKGAADVSCF